MSKRLSVGWDKDDSYLDLFLDAKVPNDLIAIYYSFIKYINVSIKKFNSFLSHF